MNFLLSLLTYKYKKKLALKLLDELLSSKTSSIDNSMAELAITKIVKSKGNKVASFIVKD